MGRRSTKTTKTGKFMNPTDQWRKQCRKKELKKNKVQRTAVREAVIKSKNPQQLLAEIEEIEKMEIEAGGEENPSDKGLKEKKRKLHETLQRIVDFYEREDYNKAQQIKTFIVESERRRRSMTTVYSSYKTARSQYDVSDIPLPEGPNNDDEESFTTSSLITDIPLPDGPSKGLIPPGPPPGPPPDIMYPKAIIARPKRSVQFMASDDEDEGEGMDSDEEGSEDSRGGSSSGDNTSDESDDDEKATEDKEKLPTVNPPVPELSSSLRPPGPPPGLPPPGIHYPPPPLFPPRNVNRFSMAPPSIQPRPLIPSRQKPSPHFQSSPVISSSGSGKSDIPADKPQTATISAQPQIRNVQAEVTKFMPTSLRVRRDNTRQMKPTSAHPTSMQKNTKPKPTIKPSGSLSKGDAYDAFMKEMEGLL